MFVFSMRPCQINSQLVNLLSLVGEDQTHLGRHVVQPVMILLVMVVVMLRVVTNVGIVGPRTKSYKDPICSNTEKKQVILERGRSLTCR